MPLPIQFGDINTRLRRFLRLVGRIPTVVDETTSVVMVAGSLDQAPYRAEPWLAGWTGNQAASVGNVSSVGIQAVVGEIIAVTSVISMLLPGAAGDILVNLERNGPVQAGTVSGVILDQQQAGGGTGSTAAPASKLFVSTGIIAAAAFTIQDVTATETTAIWQFPDPIVLYANDLLTVSPLTNNTGIRGAFVGRIYHGLTL